VESFIESIQKCSPPFEKGGREGFWGMDFRKVKLIQTNYDSTRIERYQRAILALPEDNPFRKPDIFKALKEELPIYIGRVINELTQDGYLRKSESGKKYSWTNKKNIFNIDTWVKHRVLSPTVTRSPSLDRPRERLLRLGPSELKTAELLAVLIRSGLQGESAVQAGEKLASVFGNDLQKISSQGMGELKQISRAIGKTAYCQIMAALELGKRMGNQLLDNPKIPHKISNSSDALEYCRIQFSRLAQEEKFLVPGFKKPAEPFEGSRRFSLSSISPRK
jgi:DNA repair protein RadC